MPLENIDLDAPGEIALEPVSDELRQAIIHSIETHGIHDVQQHVAIGVGLGYSHAVTAHELRECIESLI